MAINILMVDWLIHLSRKGMVGPDANLLELGPQTVAPAPALLRKTLKDQFDDKQVEQLLQRMLINETYHSTAQNMLYKFLGFGDYSSVDLIDGSSTWQVDLNHPIERTMPSYSVITNFGTAEHVFNIAQVFSTIHDLLKPNGIALHVLPAMGDADRGFWNIHPTVYFDIAMDNGYAIEDFVYVDAMNTRCLARERSRVLTEEDFRAPR